MSRQVMKYRSSRYFQTSPKSMRRQPGWASSVRTGSSAVDAAGTLDEIWDRTDITLSSSIIPGDGTRGAEHGLLVADFDVAPGHEVQKFTVFPDLAEVDETPAGLGFERPHG